MGFPGTIFGGQPASADSVTFDASRYEYQGIKNETKVWHTSDGDGLGVYFFSKNPDIPRGLTNTSQLLEYYSSKLDEKFRAIECRVLQVDEIAAVWFIAGGSDGPSGASVFVGSLTIPFHDFSYVIKMQAHERGTTGMREAIFVDLALRNGTGIIQNGKFVAKGSSADDEQFDKVVPQHPLSRLRRELRAIAGSVRIDEKVKRIKPFDLPQRAA